MSPAFFQANRHHLATKLQGGIVVLTAYTAMQRSNDMAAQFEQEANFWWLTGIEAADWWMIMDGTSGKTWLVSPEVSDVHQTFDGSLSADDALKVSAATDTLSHDEALRMLRDLAKRHTIVYTLGEPPHVEYFDFVLNPAPKKLNELLKRTFRSVQDCRKELAQLRAVKRPEEIVVMKQVINLTCEAFKKAKMKLPDMTYEYEVEAEFTYHFRRHGADGHAYEPIVASGAHACTLHYGANNDRLKKRQLLLLDIGARHHGYVADVSRTYAIGEPTKRHRAVHEAVRSAHERIISLLRPGLTVEEYQRSSDTIMMDALLSLGLVHDINDKDAYRKYFPHAISHGLGVDAHESLGGPRIFAAGMVLTVEPGIYIPEENIGVRIEDDILLTETGTLNLSGHLSTDL